MPEPLIPNALLMSMKPVAWCMGQHSSGAFGSEGEWARIASTEFWRHGGQGFCLLPVRPCVRVLVLLVLRWLRTRPFGSIGDGSSSAPSSAQTSSWRMRRAERVKESFRNRMVGDCVRFSESESPIGITSQPSWHHVSNADRHGAAAAKENRGKDRVARLARLLLEQRSCWRCSEELPLLCRRQRGWDELCLRRHGILHQAPALARWAPHSRLQVLPQVWASAAPQRKNNASLLFFFLRRNGMRR